MNADVFRQSLAYLGSKTSVSVVAVATVALLAVHSHLLPTTNAPGLRSCCDLLLERVQKVSHLRPLSQQKHSWRHHPHTQHVASDRGTHRVGERLARIASYSLPTTPRSKEPTRCVVKGVTITPPILIVGDDDDGKCCSTTRAWLPS